jgi:hypothetical protein
MRRVCYLNLKAATVLTGLALSLGRKRTVTAESSDLLAQLEETLASHHFAATR